MVAKWQNSHKIIEKNDGELDENIWISSYYLNVLLVGTPDLEMI